MSQDPYSLLGVARSASQDDIQKAYRKLAKRLHPDLNPGDKKAEEAFKAASAAYDLLSDPEKRRRFDRGEIDASGQERAARSYYRDFAGAASGDHPYASSDGFADFTDDAELFSSLFGEGGRFKVKIRGEDARYRLPVDFLDAINGATRRITLANGATLDVAVPPGARDGQILRLAGQGEPGYGGGGSGDALIELQVRPHPLFTRKGDDIHLELPVSIPEAVLGAKIRVPTPTGPVTMNVPRGSNTGTVLRLRGKGVPRADATRGDEYVALKLALPDKPDPELESFVQTWAAGKTYNPRRGMEA